MTATEKPSTATELVDLATDRYWFGVTPSGEPFAVPHNGPFVARMLRVGHDSLRAELAADYTMKFDKAPSSQACADALLVLEGRARRGPRLPLALRVARHDNEVLVDLGDESGRAAVVRAGCWSLVEESPVLFRRTELTGPLPEPAPGGRIDELRGLVNVDDRSWWLVVAWLVAALIPECPHPIAVLLGEQGTGKSTFARLVAGLIDPSPAQLRTAPRDVEAWAVAAAGSWVVALDNVSGIAPWLSDALCRAVTGDGMVRRRLYTDSSVSVLAFRRVVMLTAIDPGALRGDLAERLLPLELGLIHRGRRRLDDDITAAWADAHPRVLGALLDLTAQVLAVLPSVRLSELPRMADFARVTAAVDRVLGSNALETYLSLGDRVAVDVIDSDPVAATVRGHVDHAGGWTGTAGELLDLLTSERPPKGWPTTPQGMAAALKRAAPALRVVGVNVEQDQREPGTGRRRWSLIKEEAQPNVTNVTTSPQGADQRHPRDIPRDVNADRLENVTANVTAPRAADQHTPSGRDIRDVRDVPTPVPSEPPSRRETS